MQRVQLWIRCVLAVSLIGSIGCGARAKLSVLEGTGANPVLPPPNGSLIPLVNVVDAKGWAPDQAPDAAPGSAVVAFARDLDHPRWIHVLPNGDVLVAETNAPPRPDDARASRAGSSRTFRRKRAGRCRARNASRLLRDADGDGVAEIRTSFAREPERRPSAWRWLGTCSTSPTATRSCGVPYKEGATRLTRQAPIKVADLPGGHDQSSLDQEPDRIA